MGRHDWDRDLSHVELMFHEEPPLPYVRGSETSHAAAIEGEAVAGTQRRRVYALLHEYPVTGRTDHEMQEQLAMNPSTQRPRRIELVDAGLVRDSGRTRLTPSGRRAVVWVLIPQNEQKHGTP